MRVLDVIQKKRDGQELSTGEIHAVIERYTRGEIPDYQMSALLMAIYFQGMSPAETRALIQAMMHSGQVVDLSSIPGTKVDKHSTGGVGDKVSLVLAPLVASVGVPVPMISGRGLGHTGGTLDKLESIPGFRTQLSLSEYRDITAKIGVAMIGQTPELTPADRKLYALRDVTGTVESIPLITASILSKKLAAGPDAIVFDVKVGKAAFMKTMDDAQTLAQNLVNISAEMGRGAVALLTNMNQPLGYAIGNALEVEESIDALAGKGPADLMEIVYALSAEMLWLAKRVETLEEGITVLQQHIADGKALAKFEELIQIQGGDPGVITDRSRLPQATHLYEIKSPQTGWIASMDPLLMGQVACELGAGRATIEDVIDPAVGLSVPVKVGDAVDTGQLLIRVYATDPQKGERAIHRLQTAIEISDTPTTPLSGIYDRLLPGIK
ncbi:MAG: thymidine phosphorylase [Gemmatimonadetes bacterium]|nr:MAG: thymidine phosphorylase [Gemmatimonadota bacterium]